MKKSIKRAIELAILSGGLLVATGDAVAFCEAEAMTTTVHCFPETPGHWEDTNVNAVVATQPSVGNTQWIVWRDRYTLECYAWDMISTGEGLANDIVVHGSMYDDVLWVLGGSQNKTLCGGVLAPAIQNGFKINMIAHIGRDYIQTLSTIGAASQIYYGAELESNNGEMFTNSYLLSRADVTVYGSYGSDVMTIFGGGSGGYFFGHDGNDLIRFMAPASPTLVGCGGGTDKICGSSEAWDCEQHFVSSSCS